VNAQHTPGPWQAGLLATYTGVGWFILHQPGKHVLRLDRKPDGKLCGGEFTEADARLIAAAPELLAELRIVYERSYNPFEPGNQSEQYKRVGALIAKATGSAA
jgi:hypothetical protein